MAEPALRPPPLPRDLEAAVGRLLAAGPLPARANPGLVFERYPRCWETVAGSWELGPARRRFLADFARAYTDARAAGEPLLEARLAALSRACGDGRDYTARWRFVTGLGNDHPLDNGFTFHRLLGVPYLPGSAVKGLVRAVARLSKIDPGDEQRIFGSVHATGVSAGAAGGGLVFLDALPTRWPHLGVDLINNHHPAWTALLNAGGTEIGRTEEASAAGLEDPVPVFFLVVEPGVRLRFWIAARPGAPAAAAATDLESAWAWLEMGLRYLGIGAKTAVGYGRFADAKEATATQAPPSARRPAPPAAPPRQLQHGARVRFQITRLSKKGKWQGHLADDPDSFGTVLGEPPPGVEVGGVFEVVVGVGADLRNLSLRWP